MINWGKTPVNTMIKYFTPIMLTNIKSDTLKAQKGSEMRNPRCSYWHGNWQWLPETISLKSFMCKDFITTGPSGSHTLKKFSHEWMRRFATAFLVAAGNCRQPRYSPWGPSGSGACA